MRAIFGDLEDVDSRLWGVDARLFRTTWRAELLAVCLEADGEIAIQRYRMAICFRLISRSLLGSKVHGVFLGEL